MTRQLVIFDNTSITLRNDKRENKSVMKQNAAKVVMTESKKVFRKFSSKSRVLSVDIAEKLYSIIDEITFAFSLPVKRPSVSPMLT